MHQDEDVSDLSLEQYPSVSFPEADRRRAALQTDEALAAGSRASRSDGEILAAHPVEEVAAAIRSRLESGRRLPRRAARERTDDRVRRFPPLALRCPWRPWSFSSWRSLPPGRDSFPSSPPPRVRSRG